VLQTSEGVRASRRVERRRRAMCVRSLDVLREAILWWWIRRVGQPAAWHVHSTGAVPTGRFLVRHAAVARCLPSGRAAFVGEP